MPLTVVALSLTPTGPGAAITADETAIITQHGLDVGTTTSLVLPAPERWRSESAFQGSGSALMNQLKTRSGDLKAIDDAYEAFYRKVTPAPIDMGFYRKEVPIGPYSDEQQRTLQAIRAYLQSKPKGFGRDAQAFWTLYKTVKFFDPSPDTRGTLQQWEADQPRLRREVIMTLASVDFAYAWKGDVWEGTKSLALNFIDAYTDEEADSFMTFTPADMADNCIGLVESIATTKGAAETPVPLGGAPLPVGGVIPANPGIARRMLKKLKDLLAAGFAKVKAWVINTAQEFKLEVVQMVKIFTSLAEKVADLAFGYAIPFIGAATDLFENLWNTASAVIDSISFRNARRAVVSATGTCVEIATALQANLNSEIASNAFETVLSAGRLTGEILSAGTVGTIVGYAIEGIKWLARTLYRIFKIRAIRSVQKEIRAVFASASNMANTAALSESALRSLADSRVSDADIERFKRPDAGFAVPFRQAAYAECSVVLNQLGSYSHLIKAACSTSPFLAAVLFGTGVLGDHPSHVFHGAATLTAADVSRAQTLLDQCEDQARSVLQGCGFVVKFKRPNSASTLTVDEVNTIAAKMQQVEALSRG